jgi:hypothetical protein
MGGWKNQVRVQDVRGKATSVVVLYNAFGGGWQISERRGDLLEKALREMSSRIEWGNQLPTTQKGEEY